MHRYFAEEPYTSHLRPGERAGLDLFRQKAQSIGLVPAIVPPFPSPLSGSLANLKSPISSSSPSPTMMNQPGAIAPNLRGRFREILDSVVDGDRLSDEDAINVAAKSPTFAAIGAAAENRLSRAKKQSGSRTAPNNIDRGNIKLTRTSVRRFAISVRSTVARKSDELVRVAAERCV